MAAERARGVCPKCQVTPLRSDNETGICGYCQAGVPRPAGARELDVSGPLIDVPPRAVYGQLKTRTFSRRQLRRDVERERDLVGLRAAMLRAQLARPRGREQCASGPRPCPWVGCRYHLYLDVNPLTGSIQLNHPGRELEELAESCALDVADRGGVTLEQVGDLLGVTRERVRQMERTALAALRVGLTVREVVGP